jgi:hypothetical protein
LGDSLGHILKPCLKRKKKKEKEREKFMTCKILQQFEFVIIIKYITQRVAGGEQVVGKG